MQEIAITWSVFNFKLLMFYYNDSLHRLVI